MRFDAEIGKWHGDRSTYVWGCRCTECTKANAAYGREWKRSRRPTKPKPKKVTKGSLDHWVYM